MKKTESAGGMTAFMRRGLAMMIALSAAIGGMPDQAQGQIQIQIRGQVQEQVNDQDLDKDEKDERAKAAEAQRLQQIKQQANHWEQQSTRLLYGDLELLRASCGDLPRESRRAIAKTGEQAVKDAALRMAELQMGGRRPRGKPADEKNPADPIGLLAAALTKSVAEHAGQEQAAAFTEQLARRKDRRREAMIREIVAALDGELFLTSEQRREIEKSLREKWDDSMAVMLQGTHMNNGVRVFPGLPEDCVRPHLGAAQRERFLAQPRGNHPGHVHWQQRAWMQTVNLLNNVPPAERDPWWFE